MTNTHPIDHADISGSMAVTSQLRGKHKLKGSEKREAQRRDLQARFGEGYANHSSSAVTHVSRLQCVQSAVETQIEDFARQNPDTRIGIVTFNSDVTLIGDGSQDKHVVTGDKLNNFDELMEIGEKYIVKKPVGHSKDKLLDELWALEEGGKTALGPALQLSIAMASSRPGSSVIVCTDGMANVGVGMSTPKLNSLHLLMLLPIPKQDLWRMSRKASTCSTTPKWRNVHCLLV